MRKQNTIKNRKRTTIKKTQKKQHRHYRKRSKMENLTGLHGIERQKVIIKNQDKVIKRAKSKITNATNKIKIMKLRKSIKRS